MSKLTIAGGLNTEFASDKDEVIKMLEDALEYVKSGNFPANKAVIILCNHDVDSFDQKTMHFGRALECLGLVEVAKMEFMQEMGAIA